MNKQALSRMKRSSRMGTRDFAAGAILLVVLILVNVLVGLLPAKVTVFDVSDVGLTEISEETAKFVSSMKEDVTVYWLCEAGVVDDQMELMLTRYEEAGKHVRVETVNTTVHPDFAKDYTDVSLADYSLIVKSGRRNTVVNAADMYLYTNDFLTQYLFSGVEVPMTDAELEYYYTYCKQYYQIDILTQYPTRVLFRGESLITAALDYVTQPYIPHGYLLTGHGTDVPSETLTELIGTMGLSMDKLDLKVAQSVPVDANCLILFAPENDLNDHETALVKEYVDRGGSLMLSTSPSVIEACPNIRSICALFGLGAAPGVVEEGDVNFISGSTTTLVPSISSEHTVTAQLSANKYKVQMPNSHAIAVAQTLPAGVTVTPLFTTSALANRVDVNSPGTSLGEAGKQHVAVYAVKSMTAEDGTAKKAQLTWYGSAEAFEDDIAEDTSGGNYYYYAATMSYMSTPFVSEYEKLAAVDLSGELLSGLNSGTALGIGAVLVILLPAFLLITGIVIWMRRKRR